MIIDYLDAFFEEMAFQVLCPFLNRIVYLLSSSQRGSVGPTAYSSVWLNNIFLCCLPSPGTLPSFPYSFFLGSIPKINSLHESPSLLPRGNPARTCLR